MRVGKTKKDTLRIKNQEKILEKRRRNEPEEMEVEE